MLRKIIKKIPKVTVAAGVAMAILTSMASATSIKDYPRVAVMNFGNKAITSKGFRDQDFNLCTEYAIYQLQASGWFDLIDYEELNTIAQMHNINNSGLVDPSTIVAMGQFAGAEYMIVGNVTGLTLKENTAGLQVKNAKAGVGEHVVNASVAVRIVDIKTGRIMGAGIGKGSSTSTLTEIGFIKDKWVERMTGRSTTKDVANVLIDEYNRNRTNINESERNRSNDSSHQDYSNGSSASGNANLSYGANQNYNRQQSAYDNSNGGYSGQYNNVLSSSNAANNIINNTTNISAQDNQSIYEYGGHSYQLYNMGCTWFEARDYCNSKGGHLVIIENQGEQNFIADIVRKEGNRNSYWMGAFKENGIFKWINGEYLGYTNWAYQQPDNFRGTEDALMIYRGQNPITRNEFATWNDLTPDGTCYGEEFFGTHNFGFICEWDKVVNNSTVPQTTTINTQQSTMNSTNSNGSVSGQYYNNANSGIVDNYNANQSQNYNSSYNDNVSNYENMNTSNSSNNSSDYNRNTADSTVNKANNTETNTSDNRYYTMVKEQEVYGITIGTKQVSEIQVINAISKAIRDAFYGKMGLLTTLNDGKPLNIKTGF